jgi:hypothetical protein
MNKLKYAKIALLATVTCVWQRAVFAFEQWVDGIRHPYGHLMANAAPVSTDPGYPNAVKRSESGIKTYFANSAQTLAATAPWTYRYSVVIFGSDQWHCAVGQNQGEVPLGVCWDLPDSPQDPVQVAIVDCIQGTTLVVATGAIAAGTFLKSNGDGTVVAWATGSTTCMIGVALTASSATGDYIEMAFSLNVGSAQTVIASGTSLTF